MAHDPTSHHYSLHFTIVIINNIIVTIFEKFTESDRASQCLPYFLSEVDLADLDDFKSNNDDQSDNRINLVYP